MSVRVKYIKVINYTVFCIARWMRQFRNRNFFENSGESLGKFDSSDEHEMLQKLQIFLWICGAEFVGDVVARLHAHHLVRNPRQAEDGEEHDERRNCENNRKLSISR